jgi:ADP-heptose:LPS heptosyltransferase
MKRLLANLHLSAILDVFKRKDNELDTLLKRGRQNNLNSILVAWNRGLGDIALGLYAFVMRIKTFIPDAKITFITRKELEEGFSFLEGINVLIAQDWERGKSIDLKKTMEVLNISAHYDMIFEKINLGKWLAWQRGKLIPKLRWKEEYDDLWKRFNLDKSSFYIGVHLETETQQFYRFRKDWPTEKMGMLFEMVGQKLDAHIILFGLNKSLPFYYPCVLDLRGETSLLEMFSIIKNCCSILIAPDSGILSIIYYLDVHFPLTVISLWGQSFKGIMKQAVPSPNKRLKHIPLVGKGNDISNIEVKEVFRTIKSSFENKFTVRR